MLTDYEKRTAYHALAESYKSLDALGHYPDADAYRGLSEEIEEQLDALDIFHGDLPLTVKECIPYFEALGKGE